MPKNKRYYIKTTLDMQMVVAIPSPLGIAPGGVFFCRLTRPGDSGFQFSAAGWLREFNKNPKKEPHMANRNTNPGISENADSGVMHNPQPARAYAYAWYVIRGY